ncbi:DMT family transporter [Nitrospirillum sp. BR 11163]|uniref:DMT family transporter n=1 Tax=Nitrospirillum sp. BR 11163 TaxID=3104323 RepID=UPI002AFE8592|nr:DMT family transporter [Nitrospirillum sp. BR 11163]MEA1677461.1 DMT family transporter [Nitrospirillum sp. BR 11163]
MSPRLYLTFPLLAVLIWTGNNLVTKASAGAIPPSVIAFDRWLLAFVLLTPFCLRGAWTRRAVIRQHLPQIAVLGLLGMALYQGLAYYAAASTSATNIGIFVALVPLLTLALSAVWLRQKHGPLALVGGFVSLAGILFVLGQGDYGRLLSHGVGRGDAFMLGACVAYAGYGVCLKRWPLPLPVWTALYAQVAAALVFLLPGYLLAPPAPITTANVALILYAGIPASIVAPVFWIQGVKHLGPGRTAIFMNLLPITTAVLAALLLGEVLHTYHLVGGGLVVLGIVLAQRPAHPRPQTAAAQP